MTIYNIIEKLTTFTPLGIRFWDPVLNHQIRNGLRVTARSEKGRGREIKAFRTASDIYAFSCLPGLRGVEYQIDTANLNYIIEVEDKLQRFIKTAFKVRLPLGYSGIYLSQTVLSTPQDTPLGFLLHSAPTRKTVPWLAVIRGELANYPTGNPAAHAVLRIRTPDGKSWSGLADEEGRFAIFFPYPGLNGQLKGSPPVFEGNSLLDQIWEITVTVLYSPSGLVTLPNVSIPDYLSILNQKQASIWLKDPEGGEVGMPEFNMKLEFGKESVLKTQGLSKLLVSPPE